MSSVAPLIQQLQVVRKLSRLSLSGANLAGLDLARVVLQNVALTGADLSGANLAGATLTGVDLTGANLEGASLAGAALNQTKIHGANLSSVNLSGSTIQGSTFRDIKASNVRFVGSHWSSVVLTGVEFESCDFAGAVLRSVQWTGGRVAGGNFEVCRVQGWVITNVELTDCNFAAATLSDTQFSKCLLDRCTFAAAALIRPGLREISGEGNQFAGAMVDYPRGLSAELEDQILHSPGRIRFPPEVRAWRAVQRSRPLQGVVLATGIAAVAAVSAVIFTPSLQPAWLLEARLSRAESLASDLLRCPAVLPVGEALVARTTVAFDTRYRAVQQLSACYTQAGNGGAARALHDQLVAGAANQPDELLRALDAQARFLIDQRDYLAAASSIKLMRPLPTSPESLFGVLMLEGQLYSAQGLSPLARSPQATESSTDPWGPLLLAMADQLVEIKADRGGFIGEVPTSLYVIGEWDRVDQLIAQCPEIDPLSAWRHARAAVEILVKTNHASLALALLEHVKPEGLITAGPSAEHLSTQAEILVGLGQIDQALALVAAAVADDDESALTELAIVRANVWMAAENPMKASGELATVVPNTAWAAGTTDRYSWALATVRRALGDEEGAVQALELYVRTIDNAEGARDAMQRLSIFAQSLANSALVGAMLDRVANPVILAATGAQGIALSRLQLDADSGVLEADNPNYLKVLRAGTVAEAAQAANILVQALATRGLLEATMDQLVQQTADLGDTAKTAGIGLLLAEAVVGGANPARARSVIEKLGLADSNDVASQARAQEILVMADLALGNVDQALAEYRALRPLDDDVDDGTRYRLTMLMIDALQSASRWAEAADVARSARTGRRGADADLWREGLSSLSALGDQNGFQTEFTAAKAALPACQAERVALEARIDYGKPVGSVVSVEEACTGSNTPWTDRSMVSRVLLRAQKPELAESMLAALDDVVLPETDRVAVDCDRASALTALNRPAEAAELLDKRYRLVLAADSRATLTQARLAGLPRGVAPAEIISIYSRFREDVPNDTRQWLWVMAADLLVTAGGADRLSELEGEPAWVADRATTISPALFQYAMDQRDFVAAWAWLDESISLAKTPTENLDLIQRASQVADQSGEFVKFSALLTEIEPRVVRPSLLAERLDLSRARALEGAGQVSEAYALLFPLLSAPLAAQFHGEAVDIFGRVLGAQDDSAAINKAIRTVSGNLGGERAEFTLRARASEMLANRGQYPAALALLQPLAGKIVDIRNHPGFFDVLVRSTLASGQVDRALAIADDFPSSDGGCGAWAALAQQLPSSESRAATARTEALKRCDPRQLNADRVAMVAGALAQSDPAAALTFIETALARETLSAQDRDRLGIQHGALVASNGDVPKGRAELQKIAGGSSSPDMALQAGFELIRLARSLGADEVEKAGLANLERAKDNVWATQTTIEITADTLRNLSAWKAALLWQKRAVEAAPAQGEVRARALLGLATIEIRAREPGPVRPGESWHLHAEEARKLSISNPQIREELLGVELAYAVARAQSPAAAAAALDASLKSATAPAQMLNAAGGHLEALGVPAFADFQRLRQERNL